MEHGTPGGSSTTGGPKEGPARAACPYSTDFLEAQEARLLTERDRLRRELEAAGVAAVAEPSPEAAVATTLAQNTATANGEPVGLPDGPLSLTAAELATTLQTIGSFMLQEIDDALARLHEGTYGWDAVQGIWLREDRLRAVPWARRELIQPDGPGRVGAQRPD